MANSKKRHKSIYKRTTLAAFASVMVALTILSLVYYGVMNEHINRLQATKVYQIGKVLKANIEDNMRHEPSQLAINEQMDLLASASGTYIWLVRDDGLVIHATDFPPQVVDRYRCLEGGLIQLPIGMTGGGNLPESGVLFRNNEFSKTLQEAKVRWVSLLMPIKTDSVQKGVLQIHLPSTSRYDLRWFLTNGVGIAFLVALIISLGLTLLLMNYLTRPLEALATAAHQVMLGDYSVRVNYANIDAFQLAENVSEADDISKLMVAFNAMVAKLEVTNSEQRDMISCISHDMKTPLTSIIGFTEGILDGTIPNEKEGKYLEIIKQEALRLKGLLADMNQEGVLDHLNGLDFTDFDINAVIKRTISSLENQILAKKLTVALNLDFSGKEELLVTGDQEQINRVVYNLISNAVKFCNEEGQLKITTEYPEGSLFVRCSVEDSGPGVPSDKRNKVFGRFVKLDKSRGNCDGSGLGLYICRKILASHGQQIFVNESTELGGARFIFTLPAGATILNKGRNVKSKNPRSFFNLRVNQEDNNQNEE